MIINIRGTSGAGKSTLVKKVMELYNNKWVIFEKGRKRPAGYIMSMDIDDPHHIELGVIGHYEIACGGCDTVKTIDRVYDAVRYFATQGMDVLYEGLMPGEDVTRAVALSKEHKDFLVIELSTPIDLCVARVQQRRREKGNLKPLNEKNTRSRALGYARRRARLKDAGVRVEVLDCDTAFAKIKELLNL